MTNLDYRTMKLISPRKCAFILYTNAVGVLDLHVYFAKLIA